MRPQTPFSSGSKEALKKLLKTTKEKADFQRIQCVWLRAEFSMDAATAAKITNLKAGTVRKLWANFLRDGEKCLLSKKRGGRRNFYMTPEEEKKFLAPFLKKAEAENCPIAHEIQAALQRITSKKIAKTTVYRLLARNGWKKRVVRTVPEKRYDVHTDNSQKSDKKKPISVYPIYL